MRKSILILRISIGLLDSVMFGYIINTLITEPHLAIFINLTVATYIGWHTIRKIHRKRAHGT